MRRLALLALISTWRAGVLVATYGSIVDSGDNALFDYHPERRKRP